MKKIHESCLIIHPFALSLPTENKKTQIMSKESLEHLRDYIQMTLSPSDITWLTDELIVTLQKQEHLKPYTMEEINAILDEAERDFEAGLGIDGDDVHRELEEEFASEVALKTLNRFKRSNELIHSIV